MITDCATVIIHVHDLHKYIPGSKAEGMCLSVQPQVQHGTLPHIVLDSSVCMQYIWPSGCIHPVILSHRLVIDGLQQARLSLSHAMYSEQQHPTGIIIPASSQLGVLHTFVQLYCISQLYVMGVAHDCTTGQHALSMWPLIYHP